MKTREEKIENKLYKMWLYREELKEDKTNILYTIRNARLNGAIDLLKAIGYEVYFNPLAENQNPFTVYRGE